MSKKKKTNKKRPVSIRQKHTRPVSDKKKLEIALHKMLCEMLKEALPEATRAAIKPGHISDAADFCVTQGFTIDGDKVIPNADIQQMADLLVTEVDEELAAHKALESEGWSLCQA